MTLSESLCQTRLGGSRDAGKKNAATFQLFFDATAKSDARNLYYTFFHGEDSPFALMNISLIEDYPLTVCNKCNKRPTYYVNSVQRISLESIIREKCDKNFVFGKRHLKYDYDAYLKLTFMAMAMALVKYDPQTLYKEHVIFTVIATMFYFFRVFDDKGNYLVKLQDIKIVLSRLLDTDLSTFNGIAKYYHFYVDKEEQRTRQSHKNIPTCLKDLTECFTEGMTQTEKKEAIMKWWRCGERTARKYMQTFGLTLKKYERSDYKELHEHIDECADDICEHVDICTDRLQQSIGVVDDKITRLNDNLVNLFTATWGKKDPFDVSVNLPDIYADK